MRKKLILSILIAVIVIAAVVVLCGCDDGQPSEDRFIRIERVSFEDGFGVGDLFYDKETKVIYLYVYRGAHRGITVLLNADGTPMLYEGE